MHGFNTDGFVFNHKYVTNKSNDLLFNCAFIWGLLLKSSYSKICGFIQKELPKNKSLKKFPEKLHNKNIIQITVIYSTLLKSRDLFYLTVY